MKLFKFSFKDPYNGNEPAKTVVVPISAPDVKDAFDRFFKDFSYVTDFTCKQTESVVLVG